MKYICREELIKALEADYNRSWCSKPQGVEEYVEGARDEYDDVLKIVCAMPTADVQPALNEKEYESLCKRMAECVNIGVEDGHIAADDILLEALEKMGYEKLVKLYQDLDKWYA